MIASLPSPKRTDLMSGKHIELFLVDGEPGGIMTADVSGWTGHVLSGPRTALTRLLTREEAHRNGVYLLLGDDPDAIENLACYIGRTENFLQRPQEGLVGPGGPCQQS